MSGRARSVLAAFLSVGLATAAAAQGPGAAARGLGKWWKRPQVAERLQLSGDQVDRLERIFVKTRPELIDLKADLEKKNFAFEQAIESERLDPKAVSKLFDEKDAARSRLAKAHTMMLVEMRQVLTTEQWEKLQEMQRLFREQRRERFLGHEPRGEPAPPPE